MIIMRKWFILGSLWLCCSHSMQVLFAQSATRPNIVFILADDLGWSDLGCYGNPFNETPHIDKLAANGIQFTNAYASSPVCSPSRAAFLTGLHPARLHLTNFIKGERTDSASPVLPAPWQPFLDNSAFTLAEMLKENGYATGQVGKWHLGTAPDQMPFRQGFDYTRTIGKNGLDYYNYTITEGNHQVVFQDSGRHYLTDKLTDYGVEFIRRNAREPFFLFMSYSAPHVLLVPRGDKVAKYLFKYNRFGNKYNPYYGAMLESLDDGVGRLVEELERQGVLNNTIIVFTSDNGGVGLPELGPRPTGSDPLRQWKGHVYEGGIRVPAIVQRKGKWKQGVTSDGYFSNTDYFPTFADLLQSHHRNDSSDGRSILPLLNQPGQPFDRGALYWHYPHFSNQEGRPAAAVRLGDFKLVEHYETGQLELYNLASDISEKEDLSVKMPDKLKQMKQMLDDWRRTVNANMPVRK